MIHRLLRWQTAMYRTCSLVCVCPEYCFRMTQHYVATKRCLNKILHSDPNSAFKNPALITMNETRTRTRTNGTVTKPHSNPDIQSRVLSHFLNDWTNVNGSLQYARVDDNRGREKSSRNLLYLSVEFENTTLLCQTPENARDVTTVICSTQTNKHMKTWQRRNRVSTFHRVPTQKSTRPDPHADRSDNQG